MKITFFRIPKPKQFQYPPRYYDEEKERREQRRRELGLSDEKPDFKSQIRTNWRRINRHDRQRRQKAGISVLIYLLIVSMLIYFIFFT
jgi:hypothetical protein